MKSGWKNKIAKTQFWTLITALVVSLADAFGVPSGSVEHIVAILCAVGACVIYMLAEAYSDAHQRGDDND
jgi:hypothetical protein